MSQRSECSREYSVLQQMVYIQVFFKITKAKQLISKFRCLQQALQLNVIMLIDWDMGNYILWN
ncbi:unnamed protein product [Paramecium octaurelia]|uniref:Uncharacterized protein n=1 Tax=Paramecium octaurelia TaxID=43137 RepID=A0A8S1WQ41_PAROT|nr:unnamed protein product [Paramecium octaurelia]